MRSIPSDTASKLAMTKQTKANSADPSASIWIGRPTTPLTTDAFLEKQAVLTGASITDTSVAVCHPRQGAANTKINIGYIDAGVAKVVTASAKTKMSSHAWINSGFSEPATAISIAYDGTMPKNDQGKVEFVTESQPWVFWVYNGAMYARKLGSSTTVTLAESNCTDVSAIRAMWSEVGGFDFGLVVFFLLSGTIYYRQLIDGEWADAETVTFGPSGVTWTSIAAFRTWDYRVGVQGKTSTGDLYELFTQFMGIGKQTVEHLEIKSVKATGAMTEVHYSDTSENEHIEMSVSAGALYGGLYSTAVPTITNVYNVDNGSGDYGKQAVLTFDVHLVAAEVAAQHSAFTIVDANSIIYTASTATLGSDGKTVTLTFTDFNNASGTCQAKYTPGTVTTMAGTSMATVAKSFTPTGLVPTAIPAPEVVEVTNI